MVSTVTVKGVAIGTGSPKVCVPMVGETAEQLVEEAGFLQTLDVDVVEWRVDFFESLEKINEVIDALAKFRPILKDKPLLFTCRSAKEGGNKEISERYYFELNTAIAKTGQVDIIDAELFSNEKDLENLIAAAHANGVYILVSNHDFAKTPSKEEIVARLRKEQELGGDILKIAVMPKNAADVLTLLDATYTMKDQYAKRPMITISMSGIGLISRFTGEVFGSALTFAAAKKASAPGQIGTKELRNLLSLIHENL